MTDSEASSDDISELWGQKPNPLAPAPPRRAGPAETPEPAQPADAMAVLQDEVRRLQALVAALDPVALRREASTALETGLAAVESRLGRRLDELTRRVDALASTEALHAGERSRSASGQAAGDVQSTGRHRSWRTRRETEGTAGGAPPSPTSASTGEGGGGGAPVLTGVEARLGGRPEELADLVDGLMRRLPGRSAASDPPTNGQQPVEEARPPIV